MKGHFLRNFILSSFFILSFSFFSFAQTIARSEFRQLYTQGNLMMLDDYYDTAVKTFIALHKADSANANINFKIGVCYLHLSGKKSKAIPYLENAIRQTKGDYREDDPREKNAPEDAPYYLGQAYHYAYRFDEAIAQFKKYRDIIGKWNFNLVKEVDHWIETSENAKKLIAQPVECVITNLGDSVNSKYADYSPVISADESMLVFTSRREGTGGPSNKNIDDKFYEDIWVCNRGEYGTWSKAKQLSNTINTNFNEATVGLSADGQQLYIYKADENNKDGNIFASKLNGNNWTSPYKIDVPKVNSEHWEPSACISADGNTIYFVSDRPGGFGGRDIYQCHRLPNGNWSEPENMGPTINTAYDEDAPFIHPDGVTLFFSSKGHNSIGGFDIFYSTKIANNLWTTPVNIGYPINTTDDDIYFVTSSDGRRAYYASLRPEGKGEKDIYMVSFPKPLVQSVAILVGYLKNKDGTPIPENSSITATSKNGQVISCKPNEATGKFIQSLLPGQKYEITVEANSKKVFTDNFFLPQDSSYQNLGRGFYDRTIYIGDTAHLFSMHKVKDTAAKTVMVSMSGKILLSKNPSDPASNTTIELLNDKGNIIASAITDSKGAFEFQNIPSGKNYIIKIDENESILKSHDLFYLTDKKDSIIMPSTKEGRFFLFKNLPADLNRIRTIAVRDTTTLLTTMKGEIANQDKKKISNLKLNLQDANGKSLKTKTSDSKGQFAFENLPDDKTYKISIDKNNPNLKKNNKPRLHNSKDQLIKIASKIGSYFVFENLPADLSKMSVISEADTMKLETMKGKILSGTNPSADGINNIEVKLTDSKGNMLDTTTTDETGFFRFERLSANKIYFVRLDEKDTALASYKKIFLANEANKIVKAIDLKKKETAFKNLPANLMALADINETNLSSGNDNALNIRKNNLYPGDENFDFVIYFPYNKKEIDISIGSFNLLMDKVAKTISENGKATIVVASSSSTVPTKTYSTNEELAQMRADVIKEKVRASMSLKNIDASKISYEVSAKVSGPEYKNDAVQNRKEYEKWQFVKVIIK